MIEKDNITEEYYWPQKEIIRRFRGLEKDFTDMMESRLRMSEQYPEEYKEGYVNGIDDATEEIAFILYNRFPEIARIIEQNRVKEQQP